MVWTVMASEDELYPPTGQSRPNVDQDRVHLVFTPGELATVVDALRRAGDIELAERLARVLRTVGQGSRREGGS
jgi:hypothetical protein